MKTLNNSDLDPYDFFSDRINAKRDKARFLPYLVSNRERIEDYSLHFHNNSLESLKISNLSSKEKNDLKELYEFDCLTIKNLKQNLEKVNGGHEIPTCPYCEKDTPNTFDHYLPVTSFPEFSVHPLNLTVSCSVCNSRKNQKYHNYLSNKACFNVYIDQEPSEEYLSCLVFITEDILIPIYSADFSQIEDKKLAITIQNTYFNLDLLNRYKTFAIAAIEEFYTLFRATNDFNMIKQINKTQSIRWKKVFFNAICDSIEAQEHVKSFYKS